MKRFIFRSALFAGIVIAVFGSVGVAELWYELDAYREEVKAPPAAEILLVNDSQLQMSVDPSVEPRFFNFCAPGRTMDQAYLSAIDVFAANPGRFKTLVIDVSPFAALDKFDQPITGMGYASLYYLLHWLHPEETVRDMTGELAVFRDAMVGRRWRLFWRSLRGKGEFRSSIAGHYLAEPLALAKMRPGDFRGQWKARALQMKSSPAVTRDAPIFTHAERLVRLARENGVEPVVVTTPIRPELLAACEAGKLASFESAVSGFARDAGCRYVNLLRMELPLDCWYDAQHLNAKGAKAFTPRFTEALSDSGSRTDAFRFQGADL